MVKRFTGNVKINRRRRTRTGCPMGSTQLEGPLKRWGSRSRRYSSGFVKGHLTGQQLAKGMPWQVGLSRKRMAEPSKQLGRRKRSKKEAPAELKFTHRVTATTKEHANPVDASVTAFRLSPKQRTAPIRSLGLMRARMARLSSALRWPRAPPSALRSGPEGEFRTGSKEPAETHCRIAGNAEFLAHDPLNAGARKLG